LLELVLEEQIENKKEILLKKARQLADGLINN
jgi:hypothetical protein